MATEEHGIESQGAATRPVVMGRHMVVSCGHYLAAVVGMRMLDLGGNAVDAGVAMVFAQCVLEFQSCGLGGEVPILIYSAEAGRPVAINGNITAPAAATIAEYRRRGITDVIPGDGLLAAGVCALPDALITALDRYGTLSLQQVLAPAIALAADGFPVYESLRDTIQRLAGRFRREWPGSAALFLPGDQVPGLGDTWRNPDLAATLAKLADAESAHRHLGRSGALQAARDRFYLGDIAQAIVAFQRDNQFRDATGTVSNGLLTAADFAAFQTRVEAPVTGTYRGFQVCKCGPWSQGPVLIQTLNLLAGFDLRSMGHNGVDHIHTVVEAMKLAYADRERYYGDPDFVPVPVAGLLAQEYAAARRGLIDPRRASPDLLPGNPYPYQGSDFVPDLSRVTGREWVGGTTGTRAIDRAGNMFSAAPSGGWFRDSPVIPGLGFALGTRMQMFWLGDPAHPAALQPGKRPRTTLSPSLVLKAGQPQMVFGTPGGDQQDQWGLEFLLNMVDFGMDIQDAIDAPTFHSKHFPGSFYPRRASPCQVIAEGRIAAAVLAGLAERGHQVVRAADWGQSYTTAVAFDAGRGLMMGGASSRGERNYALGW